MLAIMFVSTTALFINVYERGASQSLQIKVEILETFTAKKSKLPISFTAMIVIITNVFPSFPSRV